MTLNMILNEFADIYIYPEDLEIHKADNSKFFFCVKDCEECVLSTKCDEISKDDRPAITQKNIDGLRKRHPELFI